jgi:hypothetical protein
MTTRMCTATTSAALFLGASGPSQRTPSRPLRRPRRRERQVAFTLLEQGDDADHVERVLFATGVHRSVCNDAALWAFQRHREAMQAAAATAPRAHGLGRLPGAVAARRTGHCGPWAYRRVGHRRVIRADRPPSCSPARGGREPHSCLAVVDAFERDRSDPLSAWRARSRADTSPKPPARRALID